MDESAMARRQAMQAYDNDMSQVHIPGRKGMDEQGSLVEKYKVKKGMPQAFGVFGQFLKKAKQLRIVKQMFLQNIGQQEQQVYTMVERLKSLLNDPEKELQGMNFPDEEEGQGPQQQPDMNIRY